MYKSCIKRLLDLIIGIIGFPFFVISLIVFGPIIKKTDKGPIFYNSKRIGKDGKLFTMFKFRSMYENAPDIRNADGSTFNSEDDSRVTKIGKILRKTSLDEIPQILNVLRGDMSIIGPRPTVPYNGFDLNTVEEVQRKHYEVRPGITGYSQAYYRNSISQEEKFIYDAYYADHVTFINDINILCKTISSVISRKNVFTN